MRRNLPESVGISRNQLEPVGRRPNLPETVGTSRNEAKPAGISWYQLEPVGSGWNSFKVVGMIWRMWKQPEKLISQRWSKLVASGQNDPEEVGAARGSFRM